MAPIAAYYTRYAGMLKGLALKPLHSDIEAVLVAMMSKLEADKARLGLSGDPATKAESEDELRSFALKVFAIADRTDQMGARDAKLLNKYMSARTFLQAFEAISDDALPPKEAELLKYCNVRCFQLSKALKAGEPVPPPPAAPGADTQPLDASSDALLDQQLAKAEADVAARAAAPRPQLAASPPMTNGDAGSIPDLPTPPSAPEVPLSPSPEPQPVFPAYFTAGAALSCSISATSCRRQAVFRPRKKQTTAAAAVSDNVAFSLRPVPGVSQTHLPRAAQLCTHASHFRHRQTVTTRGRTGGLL